jgi:hypothetical protein
VFRGHGEKLSLDATQNSINFMDLVKLILKDGPVLREHFLCINENEIMKP